MSASPPDSLPLPLKRLLERADAAEAGQAKHLAALDLAEATIKLAASARVARWLACNADAASKWPAPGDGASEATLKDWIALFRETATRLSREGEVGEPLGLTASDLMAPPPDDDGIRAFLREAKAADLLSAVTARRAVERGWLGFWETLEGYRRQLEGKASVDDPVHTKVGPALLAASIDVLRHVATFGGLAFSADDGPQMVDGTGDYRVRLDPFVTTAPGGTIGFLEKTQAAGPIEMNTMEFLDQMKETAGADDRPPNLSFILEQLRRADFDQGAATHTAGPEADEASEGANKSLKRGDRLGQYEVERLLGAGGMGAVYLARHVELGTEWAIKVLLPELTTNAGAVERFKREAISAAQTKHPGIVQVTDLGRRDDGLAYLVMEKLDGESAADMLERGPMSLTRALDTTIETLEALSAAHDRGIVHRDIKPDNVFISIDGRGREAVKVLDFGVAKVRSDDKLTRTGSLLGTPLYMSPEQVNATVELDHRADQYSVAATLYHYLTGSPPVSGANIFDLVRRVGQGLIERDPRPMRPDTPQALVDVMERALALQPEKRYRSAADMAAALADVRASLTDIAAPPPTKKQAPAVEADTDSDVEATVIPETSPDPPSPTEPAADTGPNKGGLIRGLGAAGVLGIAAIAASQLPGEDAVPTGTASTAPTTRAPATAAATAPPEKTRPPPGMVRVEGATFSMGTTVTALAEVAKTCGTCTEAMLARETPPRSVRVSPFFIDELEVSNAKLQAWLKNVSNLAFETRTMPVGGDFEVVVQGDTVLAALKSKVGGADEAVAGLVAAEGKVSVKPGFEAKPAVLVTWVGAQRYCEALGKRLPTEAEWSLAARGNEGRAYPWGAMAPTCSGVSFGRLAAPQVRAAERCGGMKPTPVAVGTSKGDVTTAGIRDLGGNVGEWVLDPFDPKLAKHQPCVEPCVDPGRDSGAGAVFHVVRGGDFLRERAFTRSTQRRYNEEQGVGVAIGFRCAKPVTP